LNLPATSKLIHQIPPTKQQQRDEGRRQTMMKLLSLLLAAVAALPAPTAAFTAGSVPLYGIQQSSSRLSVAVADPTPADQQDAGASSWADDAIPTYLPSDCGKDYIPLANMLATGELAQADQVRSLVLACWRRSKHQVPTTRYRVVF
jgi:hypothetical protein